MDIKDHIRHVPDFPKPGILFYDISTLLAHAGAWRETVRQLADLLAPTKPDVLVGIESRGFLVAAPLALALGCGFVIEIQTDAIQAGHRVVVLDDLLATGGTLNAAINLCRKVGGDVVAAACIIELTFLGGRSRIDVPVHTIVSYDE